MQVLRYSELTKVPWKNGGGITRSIAKGEAAGRVAWTISRADVVQDGAFSDFTGMVRVLTVVSGGAMTLLSSGMTLEAKPWTPVRFDGGLSVSSRLADGPLTDLNLMFDPNHCEGEVIIWQDQVKKDISCPVDGLLAYHVLAGAPTVDATALSVGDTVFIEPSDQTLLLDKGDGVLEIRLTYLNQTDAIRLCMAER